MIGIDCTGSCKSNYHKITTTRSPYKRLVKLVDHILFDIISPNLKSYLVLVRVNPILFDIISPNLSYLILVRVNHIGLIGKIMFKEIDGFCKLFSPNLISLLKTVDMLVKNISTRTLSWPRFIKYRSSFKTRYFFVNLHFSVIFFFFHFSGWYTFYFVPTTANIQQSILHESVICITDFFLGRYTFDFLPKIS
jgi:hypothetical protein